MRRLHGTTHADVCADRQPRPLRLLKWSIGRHCYQGSVMPVRQTAEQTGDLRSRPPLPGKQFATTAVYVTDRVGDDQSANGDAAVSGRNRQRAAADTRPDGTIETEIRAGRRTGTGTDASRS